MEDAERESSSLDFGTLLRRYRLAAGLSQEALAERSRLSLQGISALERGHRRTPQRETFELLAGALALNAEQRHAFEAAVVRPSSPRRRGEASVTVGPWPNPAVAKLPLALTRFVGREGELNEITDLIAEHRLVTLTGAGGVGKTQTALRAAMAVSDAAAIPVCFVSLAALVDPALVARGIAAAVGVQEVPDHPLRETLIAYLKVRSLLLVLDNCEHLIEETATVAHALITRCPGLSLLATSREPLKTAGERRYRLPPLARNEAIALFADRAQAVDAHFTLTGENAATVGEICRRLDGVPLAIELAAARVDILSLEALARGLDNRFAVLTSGERTALPRQQTMRAAIDWSYHLLSPREQEVFQRLSIFASGCTLETATTVCAAGDSGESAILDLLSSLVHKSLLVPELDGFEPRYRLLESFREYAREKLAHRGDAQLVAYRHALACRDVVLKNQMYFARALTWLDDCRSALQWSLIERRNVVLGQELVGTLVTAWYSFPVEGKRWITAANELVDERTPIKVLASLKFAESTAVGQLYDIELALIHAERSIALYQSINDFSGTARAQRLAASWLSKLERLDESDALLREALVTGRRLADRSIVGSALHKIAENKAKREDIDAARSCIAEAVAAYEELGDKSRVAQALMDLGAFEGRSGDFESSLSSTNQALAISRSNNDPVTIVICLHNLATALMFLKRYDEARQCSREALVLAREQQLMFWAVSCLWNLCFITALRTRDAAEGKASLTARAAARVIGFADAYVVRTGLQLRGLITEKGSRFIDALRETVSADELAQLMTAGTAMTEEQAFDEALRL